ncbi:MAG: glucans biosynthesis glucosyltransferase MdoH [Burkholderiaceae bacterium]|nr:glucans biosynthesis glucosyltransferase MdoH [Burkholderiaceae bacterium]
MDPVAPRPVTDLGTAPPDLPAGAGDAVHDDVRDLHDARLRRIADDLAAERADAQRDREARDAARSTPRLNRGSMAAQPWRARPVRGLIDALLGRDAGPAERPLDSAIDAADLRRWQARAQRRRRVLVSLIAASALGAATALWSAWPAAEVGVLHVVVLALFTLLFGWIAAGFWTAVAGFAVLLRGGDALAPTRSVDARAPISPRARTAVVMPICNEHVATVFAGLRATMESVNATGAGSLFDFHVLSDTRDPDLRAQEVAAWHALRSTLGASNLFHRWRARKSKKKAGNVADWCRRFGRDYRYMVVLDADSVMSGEALLALVRTMEAHPSAGIVQTAPRALGGDTLHGRVQQFLQRVTGPLFTAGMQYWQLGESHYWGHNAIIRVEPFMQHCALAPLPHSVVGRGALDGEILSHDFVEAALMRRAGWHVWVAHDLPGSYEQLPPSLATEMQRDRRWCNGNLQNARLIGEPGLHPVHRAMFITGLLSYVSAPLWLAFLLLSSLLAIASSADDGAGLLGQLATGGVAMTALFIATAAMLVLPKALAVALVFIRREQKRFGGTPRLLAGSVLELAISVLLAPVRMMFHAQFVLAAATGWKIKWHSPPREAQATSWRDALRLHGPHALVAAAWLAAAVAELGTRDVLWLLPVLLPLLVAVPLSVAGSLPSFGARLRGWGLFAVPEEVWTPAILRRAQRYAERGVAQVRFDDVVTEPRIARPVSGAMGARDTQHGLRGARRLALVERATSEGFEVLAADDKMRLLSEPQAMALLRLWLAAKRPSGESVRPPQAQAPAIRRAVR